MGLMICYHVIERQSRLRVPALAFKNIFNEERADMRRKKAGLKRRLALVLALAMALSLFAAGCGGPGGSAPDDSGSPAMQSISPLGQETARAV